MPHHEHDTHLLAELAVVAIVPTRHHTSTADLPLVLNCLRLVLLPRKTRAHHHLQEATISARIQARRLEALEALGDCGIRRQ
jgi:hypothetical protein